VAEGVAEAKRREEERLAERIRAAESSAKLQSERAEHEAEQTMARAKTMIGAAVTLVRERMSRN